MARKARIQQAPLPFFRRGGFRKGAGRKAKGAVALAAHARRSRVTRHDPVHVTTHLVDGLPSLRQECVLELLRTVLVAGSERFGFRLIEYSIQSNHLHLVVEAESATSLARGMKGLLVRVAKALNRVWIRAGRVIRDRYDARVLKSRRDMRNVLVYVLHNAKKHGARILGIDACSSGPWFAGWLDHAPRGDRALPRPESWLLSIGWTAGGLISVHEAPRGGRELDRSER